MKDGPKAGSNTGGRSATITKVRVIVVNYQSGGHLKRCLDALAAQTYTNFDAIIVDNGSSDDSMARARRHDGRFSFIELSENMGFAAASNRGARGANADWIAMLNPDAFAEPDWLGALMAATVRHPDTVMFGSTQIMEADPGRLDGCGDAYFVGGLPWRGNHGLPITEIPDEGEVFGPCAAAALYRTDAFVGVGGFDENFFCYCEDVDLAFRLRLRGEQCVQVADAVVHHVGSGISGRESNFTIFHGTRNRVWVLVKNVPLPLLPIVMAGHILATMYLIIRMIRKPAFRAMLAGLRDAIVRIRPVLRRRRQVQACRSATTIDIARAMTWSPVKLHRRLHDVRRLPSRRLDHDTASRATRDK